MPFEKHSDRLGHLASWQILLGTSALSRAANSRVCFNLVLDCLNHSGNFCFMSASIPLEYKSLNSILSPHIEKVDFILNLGQLMTESLFALKDSQYTNQNTVNEIDQEKGQDGRKVDWEANELS